MNNDAPNDFNLDSLCEYRALIARDEELDLEERARLVGLAHVLGSEVPWRQKRGTMRSLGLKVHFTTEGNFGVGEVHGVSGAGMVVTTRDAPERGARTVLRIEQDGVEFVFPARLVWRAIGSHGAMGVVFDGEPSRSLAGPTLWRKRAIFGPRATMVA